MVERSPANTLIVAGNRGIGLGFVDSLLGDPAIARVFATFRHPETAIDLRDRERRSEGKLFCLPLDATDEAQIRTTVAEIGATCDRLHLVVNCAGILHDAELRPEKSLRQLDAEHLSRYFAINSIPTALLAKHLLPLLTHDERSVLATISAKLGSIGDNHLGGWYGYRASKAALNMFVRTIANEYRRKSPQAIVVALHPGTTNTRLSQPFQKNVPPEKLFPIEQTVAQLRTVIDGLDTHCSGEFYSWDGSRLPW
ncbi:dehydrogenase with different specificities [Rubidibacter lacunae KORDI 51-2]|uniref:Dehydrogenase with different specificities n=1 Tax=Rubidibacter lacunae KORDI 51-2 TaxID=582515 RepID=U5D6Y4_9CHRO|nr:SDR family NAD(P)-dependent oxidoreductase [Rubidibacter lacunae]ERN40413.1 dehydrogenase with different specificities [Rubidibacter lacunae KORDI 51-2]